MSLFNNKLSKVPLGMLDQDVQDKFTGYDTSLAEIVHETIYLASYTSTNYDTVFQDIVTKANANNFTTIILDERTVTLTSDLIFTKPVYIKGNMCNFLTGDSKSHFMKFAEGTHLENFTTNAITVASYANNIKLDGITVSNVSNNGNILFTSGIVFLIKNGLTYGNLNIKNCTANNNYEHGYSIRDDDASGAKATIIENVTFENCRANGNGKSSSGWGCGFEVMDYTNKVKNFTFINCISNNSAESGFHSEQWLARENVTFINCYATGNGVQSTKPNAQYGYGFMNFPEFTFIGCIAEGNKRPFSILFNDTTNQNLIVFGKHIQSKGDGKHFNYPLANPNDIENWIESKCALGLGDYVYPSYNSYGFSGPPIGYNNLNFIQDTDGAYQITPKTPFIKGTSNIISTPPIPIDPKDNYTIQFLSKCDTVIANRDRLLYTVSTLDSNFKKNNTTINYQRNINNTTSYVLQTSTVGGSCGTDTNLSLPDDTKYIVISFDLSNMDTSTDGVANGQTVSIQGHYIKRLRIIRKIQPYIKSPSNYTFKINVSDTGAVTTTQV